MGAKTSAPLVTLLAETKDGEWGSEHLEVNTLPMRVIRGTDFAGVRVGNLTKVPTRHIPVHIAARKQLADWDVLIETAGGTKDQPTGRTVLLKPALLARSKIPFTCASFARFLRADASKVNPQYLYWYLQWLYLDGQMEAHQVQHTGVARFQYTRFAQTTQVPLPPRPEQRTIALILGTFDNKIELNRQLSETLEAMARALFKSWFVDFDPVRAKAEGRQPSGTDAETAKLFPGELVESAGGRIPKGWQSGTIADIVNRIGGDVRTGPFGTMLKADEYVDCGVPAIAVRDIRAGYVEITPSTPRVSSSTAERLSPFRVLVGDILFGRKGAVERFAVMGPSESGWLMGSDCIRLRTSPQMTEFLFRQFQQESHRNWMHQHATGTTMPSLNQGIIERIPLVLPPDAIVNAFAAKTSAVSEKSRQLRQESATLATLRDTILPRLLSGELNVSDAVLPFGAGE